ncbi:beta-mannosyltransferase 6 [[Candida] jaroonii]|uniref:Beta-mannosyltransferase 6 n=1 Tax=[Candida] jaroonii TaxID=467808 RepID=A0ACA9Y310_9ASCO|nr:beta-mannosyltransferase 6 [[Candida] jaroonii]
MKIKKTTIGVGVSLVMVMTFLGAMFHMKYTSSYDVHLFPHIKNIIYPKNFQLSSSSDLSKHYDIFFNLSNNHESIESNIFRYPGTSKWDNQLLKDQPYHDKEILLYEYKGEDCQTNKQRLHVDISESVEFESDLETMVKVFSDQLENDPTFKEFQPYFKEDIPMQIKVGTLNKHWYKFAGSSVWLEDYGVHLMISRVMYSMKGHKRKQLFSFTYAQVYDENWVELKNVELVNFVNDENNENVMRNLKFPCFLPVPFYHHPSLVEKVYYGTEDPRLFLITNEFGKKEPLIIFNAYHRKVIEQNLNDKESMKVKFGYYRSMFLSWPFRFQRGKTNVDGVSDVETQNLAYNQAVELRITDHDRAEVQKNWTPMLKYEERKDYGYDRYVYFIYRWSNLEILRCNLNSFTEGTSSCDYEYKRLLDSSKDEVGPLRGGTEMINLRDIVKDKSVKLPDREIWIGFPRAHIKGCGCGKDMYRPNLAVITKEADDKYKISHLSSFTSLDVEVYGWTNPHIQCASKDANVLISNGISNWEMKNGQDFLTLSLSVADATNNIIHIKNLLSHVIFRTSILTEDTGFGYDEVVVNCALDESTKFCKNYGMEMKKLGKSSPPEPDYDQF